MTDMGKQVRELLPEYPHLWSRVITLIERLEQENVVLLAAVQFAEGVTDFGSGGFPLVTPQVLNAKLREALDKARVLREGGK